MHAEHEDNHLFIYSLYCVCWFEYAWSGNVPCEFEVLVMRILNYVYLSLSHNTNEKIFLLLPFNYASRKL